MKSLMFRICRWILLFLLLAGCRMGKGPAELPPEKIPPHFDPYAGEPLRLPQRRRPLEDFERIANLNVVSETGRAFLLKNTDQPIWGSSAAELRFIPEKTGIHTIILSPETPWGMPSLFDNLSLWVRDEGEGAVSGVHQISVRIRDAQGLLEEILLPYSPAEGWQMLHKRIVDPFRLPVQIEQVRWTFPAEVGAPRRLLLEGLTLYQEVLSRIPMRVAYRRPFGYAPAFAPVRENSVTLNFPTSEYAFHPKRQEDRYVVNLTSLGKEMYQFECSSPSGVVAYKIEPGEGGPRIDVRGEAGKWIPAWSGPKVVGLTETPTLRFSRIRGEELYLQYTDGVTFTLSMRSRTLRLTVESLREGFSGLDLGALSGEEQLQVPFLRVGEKDLFPVSVLKQNGSPVFLTVFPDWWASMASGFQRDSDTLGRLTYLPRWRGARNLFRERVYFTASPRLEDVLPTVSAPPALYADEVSRMIWPIADTDQVQVHALFRLHPTERSWEDAMLAREPDGEWRLYPDEPGVVMKTALASDLLIPRLLNLEKNNKTRTLFLPEATSHGPWRFTDFDNRVIGAGTFAQTYAEMGALFQQAEAEWGAAFLGAGGAEMLWAGLISGFVPEFPSQTVWSDPWIPHLAWNAINPVSRVLGMGGISFFSREGESAEKTAVWLDRSLATQVVYGAPGRIPPEGITERKRVQSERLISALQTLFRGRSAERIAYWNGNALVDLSNAVADGTYRNNQIYVRLDNQTELWVNGSQSANWERRISGKDWVLPPFGFLVRSAERMIVHLPRPDGEPGVTLVETPESTWFSSQDAVLHVAGMAFQGCIRMTLQDNGEVRLDIEDWQGEARFDVSRFPLENVQTIRAIDSAGNPVPDVSLQRKEDTWVFQGPTTARTVWFSKTIQGPERNLSP